MSQDFDVRKTDVDALASWIGVFTGNTVQALESLATTNTRLESVTDFSGAAADASQAYWTEVHEPVLIALRTAVTELYTRYGEYVSALNNLDGARDARFSSSTIDYTSWLFGPYSDQMTERSKKVGSTLADVADIVGFSAPKETDFTEKLFDLSDSPRAHHDSIDGIESIYAQSAQALDPIIAIAEQAIAFTGQVGSFESYKAGSSQKEEWFLEFGNCYSSSSSYISSRIEGAGTVYEAAIERVVSREKEAAIREKEAARRDEGWSKIIPALVGLGGGALTIFSGGIAAPLAAPMMAFAGAELIEGAQEVWYADHHDVTTTAWNPLRDTIFFGNQDAYNTASGLANIAGSFGAPAAMGYKAFTNGATLREISAAVGGSLIKGKIKGDIKAKGVDVAFGLFVDPIIDGNVVGPKTREALKQAGRDVAGDLIPDAGDNSKKKVTNDDLDVDSISQKKFASDIPEVKDTSKKHLPLIDGPYIKNGKQNGRPKLTGKRLLEFEWAVYNRQVDEHGILRDPHTKEIIDWKPGQPRKGVCDFGHKPDAKYSKIFEKYANGEISLDELKAHEFNPENFRIEAPSANRSHKYE